MAIRRALMPASANGGSRAGVIVSLGIFLLGLGSLVAVFAAANNETNIALDNLFPLVAFSVKQALLSAALSVVFALLVSLSITHLARWSVFSRYMIPALLHSSAAMIVLPTTVAAHAVLIVWGRNGLYTPLREALDFSLFGLGGILLGHVFLNMPMCFRLIAPPLLNLPEGLRRQAVLLNFSPQQWWRILAYPSLKPVLIGSFGLTFLLCFTSFSLVLMLGGGPAAATLEVAIYEAVRFELNFTRAGLLSVVQLLLCGVFLMILPSSPLWLGGYSVKTPLPNPPRIWLSIAAISCLCLALAFLLPPMVILIWRGSGTALILWLTKPVFYQSLLYSLGIALGASVGNILLCLTLIPSLGQRGFQSRIAHLASNLFLFIPTMVFGTGLFLVLRHFSYPDFTAPLIVLTANILFTLPFSMRILAPPLLQHRQNYARQYTALGLTGFRAGWWGAWRACRSDIRFAAALSAAFSLGDLGVIALFNSNGFTTLPWLLYTLLGRYQTHEAAALAVWQIVMIFGLFLLGGKNAINTRIKSRTHA